MDFTKYHLLYNAAAHFKVLEKYPDGGITKAISDPGIDGYAATCWALELLSTQGELARRDMGHDHEKWLTEEQAMLHMTPGKMLLAKQLVIEAISEGLRTTGPDEEVDEVLMELQKKTGTG